MELASEISQLNRKQSLAALPKGVSGLLMRTLHGYLAWVLARTGYGASRQWLKAPGPQGPGNLFKFTLVSTKLVAVNGNPVCRPCRCCFRRPMELLRADILCYNILMHCLQSCLFKSQPDSQTWLLISIIAFLSVDLFSFIQVLESSI
jgi:hypothetical protein